MLRLGVVSKLGEYQGKRLPSRRIGTKVRGYSKGVDSREMVISGGVRKGIDGFEEQARAARTVQPWGGQLFRTLFRGIWQADHLLRTAWHY